MYGTGRQNWISQFFTAPLAKAWVSSPVLLLSNPFSLITLLKRTYLYVKHILKNTLLVLDKNEKKHFTILIVLDIFISIVDILSLALLLWIIQFYIEPVQPNALSFFPGWLLDR